MLKLKLDYIVKNEVNFWWLHCWGIVLVGFMINGCSLKITTHVVVSHNGISRVGLQFCHRCCCGIIIAKLPCWLLIRQHFRQHLLHILQYLPQPPRIRVILIVWRRLIRLRLRRHQLHHISVLSTSFVVLINHQHNLINMMVVRWERLLLWGRSSLRQLRRKWSCVLFLVFRTILRDSSRAWVNLA